MSVASWRPWRVVIRQAQGTEVLQKPTHPLYTVVSATAHSGRRWRAVLCCAVLAVLSKNVHSVTQRITGRSGPEWRPADRQGPRLRARTHTSLCSKARQQPIAGNRAPGRTRQPRRPALSTHTRPALATSSRRRNCFVRPCTVGALRTLTTGALYVQRPAAPAPSSTSTSSTSPAIAAAAAAAALLQLASTVRPTQPFQAPSHNVDCSFQRRAALRSFLTRQPAPPQYSSALASRLSHRGRGPAQVVRLSFQQHGRHVSVALCHQT